MSECDTHKHGVFGGVYVCASVCVGVYVCASVCVCLSLSVCVVRMSSLSFILCNSYNCVHLMHNILLITS